MCACLCVLAFLFTRALCRVACGGHTWEGGTLHSLFQARWLLSPGERGGGAMEGKRGRRGALSRPLTAPEWPVPRATTSGDHLQLAHPASSIFPPSPSSPHAHAHFLTLFFQMRGGGGGGSGGSGVFGQAVICAHNSLSLVCVSAMGRAGGRSGWEGGE